MRIYHFLNRRYGIEDIKRRRLKISRISELNDPFELLSPVAPDKDFRQAYKLIRDQINLRWGLLCFSQSWQNPVQWSHYADRHRGLCLGFDMPDQLLEAVRYVSRRPVPNFKKLLGRPDMEFLREEIKVLMLTKFSHWRYEKEVRHFVPFGEDLPLKELWFQPFCKGVILREVIVGHNSSIRRLELERALGALKNKVSVFKARLAFRSYKIVKQRDESLWK